jgi:hypothetical protein
MKHFSIAVCIYGDKAYGNDMIEPIGNPAIEYKIFDENKKKNNNVGYRKNLYGILLASFSKQQYEFEHNRFFDAAIMLETDKCSRSAVDLVKISNIIRVLPEKTIYATEDFGFMCGRSEIIDLVSLAVRDKDMSVYNSVSDAIDRWCYKKNINISKQEYESFLCSKD